MNIASFIPFWLVLQKLVELDFQSGDLFSLHHWMINLFVFALGVKLCEHF